MDKRIHNRLIKASALGFSCRVINDKSLIITKDRQSILYYIDNDDIKYIEYNDIELVPISDTDYIRITNIRYKKNGKTYEGLIDIQGNSLIDATNDRIRHLYKDLFSIQINNLQGVVNVKTHKSTPVSFSRIEKSDDNGELRLKLYKDLAFYYTMDELLNEIDNNLIVSNADNK